MSQPPLATNNKYTTTIPLQLSTQHQFSVNSNIFSNNPALASKMKHLRIPISPPQQPQPHTIINHKLSLHRNLYKLSLSILC